MGLLPLVKCVLYYLCINALFQVSISSQKLTRSELDRLVYANDESVIEDRLRDVPEYAIYPPGEDHPSMPTMDPPLHVQDESGSQRGLNSRRRRLRNKSLVSDLMMNLRMLRQTGANRPRTRQGRTFTPESPPVRSPYLKSRLHRPSTLITSAPDELQVAFKRIEIMASRSGLSLSDLPRRSQLQVVKKLMNKLDPRKREMVRASMDSPNNLEKVFRMLPEPARDPLIEDDPEYLLKMLGEPSSRETEPFAYTSVSSGSPNHPQEHPRSILPSSSYSVSEEEYHSILRESSPESPDLLPAPSTYGSDSYSPQRPQNSPTYEEKAHIISITSPPATEELPELEDTAPETEYGEIKTLDRLPSSDIYKQDEHNTYSRDLGVELKEEGVNSFDIITPARLVAEHHGLESEGSHSEPIPMILTPPKHSKSPQSAYPRPPKAINFVNIPSPSSVASLINSTNVKTSFSVSSSIGGGSNSTTRRPLIRVSVISKDDINLPGKSNEDEVKSIEENHSKPSEKLNSSPIHVYQLDEGSPKHPSSTPPPQQPPQPQINSFNSFTRPLQVQTEAEDDDYIEESILIDYLLSRNKNRTQGKSKNPLKDPWDIDYLDGDSEEIIKNMMEVLDSNGKLQKDRIRPSNDIQDMLMLNPHPLEYPDHPDHPVQFGQVPEQLKSSQYGGGAVHQGHSGKNRPSSSAEDLFDELLEGGGGGGRPGWGSRTKPGEQLHQQQPHGSLNGGGGGGGGPPHGKKRVRTRPQQPEMQQMLRAQAAALRWNRLRIKHQNARPFPRQPPHHPFLRNNIGANNRRNTRLRPPHPEKSRQETLRVNEVKVSELPHQFHRECDYFSDEICLLVQDYPIEAIEDAFAKNPSLKDLLVKEPSIHANSYVEGVPKQKELKYSEQSHYDDPTHKHRDFAGEGGFLCPSKVAYGRIKKAKSASEVSKWKFIVNYGEEMSQTLRLEKCLSPGNSCSYVMPYYRTACTQVYNYHRLLAWDHEKGLHMDVFKVPTVCTCHVQGYYVPSAKSPPKPGPPPPPMKRILPKKPFGRPPPPHHGHHGHPLRSGHGPVPLRHNKPHQNQEFLKVMAENGGGGSLGEDEDVEDGGRMVESKKENIQDLLLQYQNLRERIAKLNAAKKGSKTGEDSSDLKARVLPLNHGLSRLLRRRSENSKKSALKPSKTATTSMKKKSTSSTNGSNMLLVKKSLSVQDWLKKMKNSKNVSPSSVAAAVRSFPRGGGGRRSGRKMSDGEVKGQRRRGMRRRRPNGFMKSLGETLSSVFGRNSNKNSRRMSPRMLPRRGRVATSPTDEDKDVHDKKRSQALQKDIEETLLLRRAIARLRRKLTSLDKVASQGSSPSLESLKEGDDAPKSVKMPNPKELALEKPGEATAAVEESKKSQDEVEKKRQKLRQRLNRLRQRLAFRKGNLPEKVNYSHHPIMDYYQSNQSNSFAPRK